MVDIPVTVNVTSRADAEVAALLVAGDVSAAVVPTTPILVVMALVEADLMSEVVVVSRVDVVDVELVAVPGVIVTVQSASQLYM